MPSRIANKSRVSQLDVFWRSRRVTLGFLILFALHFVLAVCYEQFAGVDISNTRLDTWDACWQTIPIAALQTQMARSIFYLHSQPPIFNIYGGLLIKLFYPHHLSMMQYANILLGSLLGGMMFVVTWQMVHRVRVAFLIALIVSLNPSLFLYEAYVLYDLLTAFIVGLCLFMLSLFQIQRRLVLLYGFVAALNLLILTRSLYHIVILLVAIPMVCVFARVRWKQALIACLLISLPSVAWCGKNLWEFGFFGSSSWQGWNLWKIVSANYTPDELKRFADLGIVDSTVAEVRSFSRPSDYVDRGFAATSPIDVLSQDDYNNINVVAISQLYQRNALRLVRHDPWHYAVTVLRAYWIYVYPSSRFEQVRPNASEMGLHEVISSQVLQGSGAVRLILLPASLCLYVVTLFRTCRFSAHKWIAFFRTDPVALAAALLICYTTLVGCLCEYGENMRFKFVVEQVQWCFACGVLYRAMFTKPPSVGLASVRTGSAHGARARHVRPGCP